MLRLFEASFSIYNKLIAERFNIDLEALEKLMEDVPTMLPISVVIKPSTALHPPQGTVKAVIVPKDKDNTREVEPKALVDSSCCSYYIKRGPKANTICGTKLRKGSEFCGKHTKKEDKPQKKKEKEENEEAEEEEPTATTLKKKNHLVLRMNKVINKWWHSESGLVFKSSDDKVVIGVFKDDQVVDLSDKDIEKCIAYKFRYEVTKRKRSEEDEEELAVVTETKKQKTEDNDFINLNKSAKNVEALIKEMFTTTTPSQKKGDDSESEMEEVNEEMNAWDGGAEETKTNDFNVEISESEEEDVCDEEEMLEEEENDDE